MSDKVLVVRGGRLIDGTGRPPLDNAVIVIRDGRFAAVGRDGEVAVPPGAEVIDVAGKTVLPGFIDGHAHLEDFHGELYLHLGITTAVTIEIFQDGPWTLAQKRGTELRQYQGAAHLDVGAGDWWRPHRNRCAGLRARCAATSRSRRRRRRARRFATRRSRATI